MRVSSLAPCLALLIAVTFGAGCPGNVEDALESAKFFLDKCNPADANTADSCTSALNEANKVLDDDSIANTNVDKIEAAVLAASARMGLAGLDFLQFAAEIADIPDDSKEAFKEFQDLISNVETDNNREIDLDQLELAKEPLVTVLGEGGADEQEGSEDNASAFFQLGTIRGLDAFVRPAKLAQVDIDAGNIATLPSLSGANETEADRAELDFLRADNALETSALDEITDELSDILRPVRENYCRCSLQTPLGGTAGFSAACLRDLQRCQLGVDDPDNVPVGDTLGLEQDYNDDGDTTNADCDTLLDPAGLDACAGANTT